MTSVATDSAHPPFPDDPYRQGISNAKGKRSGAPANSGARDMIVRDIVRGLYEGRYEPGQRLQEAQLTSAYGISRGPVREAIYALAAMNIVELVPQCGAQVRIVSIRDAIDTLIVAQQLIGLSARLAADRYEDGTARQMLNAALEAINGFDANEMSAASAISRDAFYRAITNMAANAELSRLLPMVRVHLIRIQFRFVLRADDGRRRADYRRIAAAICAGESTKAETAARAHLARSIALLKAHLAKPN
jgi:DNA-binding GntR family transcriptional regulator